MFTYNNYFITSLNKLKQAGNYRHFLPYHKSAGYFPIIKFEKNGSFHSAVNFCSNDYLAMSTHEDVIKKHLIVTQQSGTGSGGTRNIAGTTIHHHRLEQCLAQWHSKEAALLFGSAYLANESVLNTLGKGIPELIFISDERNHASIIEGIRNSGNRKYIFKHNNTLHLQEILSSLPITTPKIIVFESVYSMNGSIAPVAEIIKIAKKYNALTYLDEVHAIGIYGETGAGIAERECVTQNIDIINGTLAKSIGVIGGYITASSLTIDFLRSFTSGFIFTSSLPPAICAAAEKSIEIIKASTYERQAIISLVHFLRRLLKANNIPFAENDSHITAININNSKKCKSIAHSLLYDHEIYVQPINYPTVPEGESCLRITVTTKHARKQIEHLVESLKKVFHYAYKTNLQEKSS
jgi:5-aminolevulinate synthase